MKRLMLITMLLFGCGQEQSRPSADISMVSVYWEGSLIDYSDPYLLQAFNETSNCINSFGYERIGYPYLKIVSGPFTCGTNTHALGCTSFNDDTIYLIGTSYQGAGDDTILYVDPYDLVHEAVHWVSGLDNSAHDSEIFKTCSPY